MEVQVQFVDKDGNVVQELSASEVKKIIDAAMLRTIDKAIRPGGMLYASDLKSSQQFTRTLPDSSEPSQ